MSTFYFSYLHLFFLDLFILPNISSGCIIMAIIHLLEIMTFFFVYSSKCMNLIDWTASPLFY